MDAQAETKVLPAESTHWYAKDGTPVYEVEAKKGGTRATHIGDARKLDLVPSVTNILNVAAKPGLEAWKAKQILEASLTLPQLPGETLDDYAVRVIEDSKAQGKAAAERGTQLHAAIEKAIQGEDFDISWREHVEKIFATVSQQCGFSLFDSKAEHSFASPLGYGGKIDAHTDEPLIIDFKTKDKIDDKKQLAYENHVQQLAAYGFGMFTVGILPNPMGLQAKKFRAINVFIGVEDKQVRVVEHTWEDLVEGFAQFRCLLEYWCRTRKFGKYAKGNTK